MSRRAGYLAGLVVAVSLLVVSVVAVAVAGLSPWSRGPVASRDVGRGGAGMHPGGAMGAGGGMGMGTGMGAGMRSGAGPGVEFHGWSGTGPLTADQARAQAQTWLSRYATGATLDAAVTVPMGYRFSATRDGSVVAVIMVDDDTGSVQGRLWAAATGSPAPAPSLTAGSPGTATAAG